MRIDEEVSNIPGNGILPNKRKIKVKTKIVEHNVKK